MEQPYKEAAVCVKAMEYKKLGKTDMRVSSIGFGTAFRGGITPGKASVLRRAVELGINFFDTAEAYERGGIKSEEVVGEALKQIRDRVFIATKVSKENLGYDDVLGAAQRSLKRLRTSYIDLYQLHQANPLIPIRETMKAMEQLVQEGKVRYIGVSNFDVNQMREAEEALSRAEISSNQVCYNLIQREIQRDILPYCASRQVSVIAYSPLAIGLLSGTVKREFITSYGIFQGERLAKNLQLVEILRSIGSSRGKTPAQVALNWLVAKPLVVPIPGFETTQEVEEGVGAVDWRLTQEEVARMESAAERLAPYGEYAR